MSDGTTLLFGLPGVEVERVERLVDGTRVVAVVTAEPTAAQLEVAEAALGACLALEREAGDGADAA